jgi:hypothetical protein
MSTYLTVFTSVKFIATSVKFIATTVRTATSDTHHCSCLGNLGQCNTDRIVSISCCATQGGQGKYCRITQGDCHVLLLPTDSLTNVANVNDPLDTGFFHLLTKVLTFHLLTKVLRFHLLKQGFQASLANQGIQVSLANQDIFYF